MRLGDAGTPAPDVVITPLARAMLRPFAAVVLPGADDRSLGRDAGATTRSCRAAPSPRFRCRSSADRRDAELLAFAQVLRLPRVTSVRRRGDAGDPVAASPFVERLRSALAGCARRRRAGRPARLARPARRGADRCRAGAADRAVGACRAPAAAPVGEHLRSPARLSLSFLRAERARPARSRRARRRGREARLRQVAARRPARLPSRARNPARPPPPTRRVCARSATACAPRWASTRPRSCPTTPASTGFVPRYVAWLHARERLGWRWQSGESRDCAVRRPSWRASSCTAASIASTVVDDGATLELIDYKTGSAGKLKNKVLESLRGHPARVLRRARRRRASGLRELPRHRSHPGPRARSRIAASPTTRAPSSPASPTSCGACARAPACRRSARARRATTARRAGLCRRDHWSPDTAAPMPVDAPRG